MIKDLVSRSIEWAVGPYGHTHESLGVYYNKHSLTVVHVTKEGQECNIVPLDKMSIPDAPPPTDEEDAEPSEPSPLFTALEALTPNLSFLKGKTLPTLLALDAGLYDMQFYHSDFEDAEQIKQTLRFDIEEDALQESESVYLCYQKLPTSGSGQDNIVFSVSRDEMHNLTTSFAQNELDCLSVEPNGISWNCFLKQQESLPVGESALVLGRTGENLYFLVINPQGELLHFRSAPCLQESDVSTTLSIELQRLLATIPDEAKPQSLWLHRHGFTDVQVAGLQESFTSLQELNEPDIDRAFAAGAALAWFNKNEQVDFRKDGLVPVTFEQVKKKAWLGLSVAISLFFLFLIFVMGLHHRQHEANIEFADEAILATWEITYPGRKAPRSKVRIPSIMAGMLKELQFNNLSQSSQSLAGSSSHTFYLLLEALESLPAKFDLALDTLRVGKNSVDLSGTVASSQGQVTLDEAFEANGRFTIDKWTFGQSSSNRSSFDTSLRINQPSKESPNKRARN